jgi:hypothetical protein
MLIPDELVRHARERGWPLIIRGIDMPVESTPKIATHAARSRCVCIIVLGKQALQEK